MLLATIATAKLQPYAFYLYFLYRDDMDTLMHRIEWSTLLFFAAMFIQLECLERLRLISWFSQQTISLITLSDDPNVQLTFAIIILMWVSQSYNLQYMSTIKWYFHKRIAI